MTYDSWKLATPPEYEWTGNDELEQEIKDRDALIDKLVEALDAVVDGGSWQEEVRPTVHIDRTVYNQAKAALALATRR